MTSFMKFGTALLCTTALAACFGAETPAEPETPAGPSAPDQPSEPTMGDAPDTPNDPAEPQDPGEPDEPEAPQSVENAWSDPDTWGGEVPKDGDYVEIEEGRTVTLDTDTANLNGLAIKGTLRTIDGANAKVSITSDFVAVEGLLEIGTEADPFDGTATITLTGTEGATTPYSGRIGNKALGVVGQGRLELHGVSREQTAWTQVEGDLQPGATSFAASEFVTWKPGDRLVIAPSRFDPLEAEEVTVTASNGRRVEFTPALKYPHLGSMQTFEGKTVDMRAEVGLLNRNIVIRGDGTGETFRDENTGFTAGFGAHSIFRDDSTIHIEGVEFTNTGQSGNAGRYAAHWHLAGDHRGDYIKDSSIHHSFQRAVVMHQTNFVTAEDNVSYHVGNHAYIPAEDGNEDGNVFRRNLAVLTYSPRKADFSFFQDDLPSDSSQGEFRSSGFWMRSANHVFEDNHAAGAWEGMGFFFDRVAAINNTATTPMTFRGNVAHTIHRVDPGFENAKTYKEITKGHALFVGEEISETDVDFQDFTAYASFSGAWLEDRNVTLSDSILSDNGVGVFIMQSVVDDVVIVGESAADVGRIPEFGAPEVFKEFWSGGIQAPPSHGKDRAPIIKDATVINQKDAALVYNRPEIGIGTTIERLKVVNTPRRAVIAEQEGTFWYNTGDQGAFDDPNGQLAGDGIAARWARARSAIVTDDCRYDFDVQAHACNPEDSLRVQFVNDRRETPARLIDLDTGSLRRLQNRFNRWGFVRDGGTYEVGWNDVTIDGTMTIRVGKGEGKSVTLALPASGRATSITQDDRAVPSVSNRSSLDAASGSASWYDADNGLLFVKLRGDEDYEVVVKAPLVRAPEAQLFSATEVERTVPGLSFARYASGSDKPRLRSADLGRAVQTGSVDDVVDPAMLTARANESVVLKGYLNIPMDGTYVFALDTKAHADLYINGTWIAGRLDDTLRSKDRQVGVTQVLEAGLHPIEIVLSHPPEASNESRFRLFWRQPGEEVSDANDLKRVPASVYRRAP